MLPFFGTGAMKDYIVLAALVFVLPGVSSSMADEPIEIGSRRQLFVDRYLIDCTF